MEKGCALPLSLSGTDFIEMNTPPPHMCIFTYIGIVCLGPFDFFDFFDMYHSSSKLQAEGGEKIIIL